MRPDNVVDYELARLPDLQAHFGLQTIANGGAKLTITSQQIHKLPDWARRVHLKSAELHLTERRHKHPEIPDRVHLQLPVRQDQSARE